MECPTYFIIGRLYFSCLQFLMKSPSGYECFELLRIKRLGLFKFTRTSCSIWIWLCFFNFQMMALIALIRNIEFIINLLIFYCTIMMVKYHMREPLCLRLSENIQWCQPGIQCSFQEDVFLSNCRSLCMTRSD